MAVEFWSKLPGERLLVGYDWTDTLAEGDSIAVGNTPAPVIPDGSDITLEYVVTVENVAQYYLSGGTYGRNDVTISVTTTNGEILQACAPVIVHAC